MIPRISERHPQRQHPLGIIAFTSEAPMLRVLCDLGLQAVCDMYIKAKAP